MLTLPKKLFSFIFITLLFSNSSFSQRFNAWISGSPLRNQNGNHGTLNLASASNMPGGRHGSASWTSVDTLWMFGGFGRDGSVNLGHLNDLWKYNKINGHWTWISGSHLRNQFGNYGTKGVGSTSNIPGARYRCVTWTVDDTLWLFGGYGFDDFGTLGNLGDLWKYNISNGEWTWVAGSNIVDQSGIYGTFNVGSTTNNPGSRSSSVSWIVNDTLWLFGGDGLDSFGVWGKLNDLWKFNISNLQWTWVSGSPESYQQGSYGTLNAGSSTNIPGARLGATAWVDQDSLWLFGGQGLDSLGNDGLLNDLWKYNIVSGQWTWMSGSKEKDQTGVYGTRETGNSSNIPGSRESAIGWAKNDTLWIWSGNGVDESAVTGRLNDLWKFDKSTFEWTWVNGSKNINQAGIYGTKGTGSTSNIPGARTLSLAWLVSDSIYAFGGYGLDSANQLGYLNDLWKINRHSAGAPLPVSLLDFYAECENDGISMRWTTASEINNKHFAIYYIDQTGDSHLIKEINGAGNSNILNRYEFKHTPKPAGENHIYQLLQVDFDNKTESFQPKFVHCNAGYSPLNIYPNPAAHQLTLQPVEKMVKVHLYNSMGAEVMKSVIYPEQNSINISEIPEGCYVIQMVNNQIIQQQKIVIIR